MKILLIDPPWYSLQGTSNSPVPLGLGYLGTCLIKAGHKCLIFSGEIGIAKGIIPQKTVINENLLDISKNKYWNIFLEKLILIINKYSPELIGISVPTAKYRIANSIAREIKKRFPDIFIAVGGPHPTILPKETLMNKDIDFVIRGEGEITIVELVKALEEKKALSKVDGLSYKKNKKLIHNRERKFIENLDTLLFPDWEILYGYKKMHKNTFGSMISSRGCPYQCIFCASKKIWSTRVRFRSPENLFQELEEKNEKYGTDLFTFNDDSFTLKKERVIKLCELILKSRLKISWKCDTRVNLIDYKLLKMMKKAGCVQINMGIECGNEKMLKYIKKGIDIPSIIKAFEIAHKVGIETLAYFMTGFPEETKKDLADTVKLMMKVKPSHPCWSIATPYPGTELYDLCKKEGLIKEKNWEKYHHHSDSMGFSKYMDEEYFKNEIKKIERKSFMIKVKYYLTHLNRLFKELRLI